MFNKKEDSMKNSIKGVLTVFLLSLVLVAPAHSGVVSNFLMQEASKKINDSVNKKTKQGNSQRAEKVLVLNTTHLVSL